MSSPTDKVNILTYNFFLRPPGINNNGCDFKEERLALFLKSYLPLYDIVCMQEVFAFGSSRKKRLIDAAKNAGFPYHKSGSSPCMFTGIDGGLLILSKFPIVRSSELIYKHGTHSDAFSNKGCLYATINIRDDFNIHVFDTHTQASYTNNPPLDDKSVQVRLQQIVELRKFVEETLVSKPPGEPVFLCGDFNVNSRNSPTDNDNLSSPEYHAMYQILSEGTNNSSNAQDSDGLLSHCIFKDLLFERLKYHPITFADFIVGEDGKIIPRETVLTIPADLLSGQCLDYIFQMEEDKETIVDCKYQFEVQSIQVEPLYIEEPTKKFPCTQLSDHYGVSAQVTFR